MDGTCACGAVRYRMTSAPMFVHGCHCTDCQRETGSALAINALIEADRIELVEGDVHSVTVPTRSGNGQTITRCPRCQVALFSTYDGLGPKIRFVRVGTLLDPSTCPPDIHIYTRSKQPWVTLPEGVPSSEGYYRRSEHWPAESIARRDAALSAE